MSIAERARVATRLPGKDCSVCTLLASVDEAIRADLLEAIEDRTISARALYEAIEAEGLTPPAYQQIGHHRRGSCKGTIR